MAVSSAKKRAVINTSCRYASIAVGTLTRFFLTPFLLSRLGVEMYGLQTLTAQALGLVGMLSGAISVSYRKHATACYAQKDFAGMNSYLFLGFLVSSVSALILVVGTYLLVVFAQPFFGLSDQLLYVGRAVIAISGISNAAHVLLAVYASPTFIKENMYIGEAASIVSTIISAVSVVIIFSSSHPSLILWALIANCTSLLAEMLITLPWGRKFLPEMKLFPFPKFQKSDLISLMSFGGLSFIGGIANILFYGIDSILITNLQELGIGKIVYYNVAQRWDPMVRMGITAFSFSLMPALITRFASGDIAGSQRLLLKGTRYCLLLGALPCMCIVIFAKPFLHLWLGGDFAEVSGPVLQIVMSAMILFIPEIMAFEALLAAGRLEAIVFLTIFLGLCNVFLAIFLVKFCGLGILGIALATVLMLTVKNSLVTPVLVSKHLELPLKKYIWQSYSKPLLVLACSLPPCFLLSKFVPADSWLGLGCSVAASIALYLPCVWMFGISREERKDIQNVLLDLSQKVSGRERQFHQKKDGKR